MGGLGSARRPSRVVTATAIYRPVKCENGVLDTRTMPFPGRATLALPLSSSRTFDARIPLPGVLPHATVCLPIVSRFAMSLRLEDIQAFLNVVEAGQHQRRRRTHEPVQVRDQQTRQRPGAPPRRAPALPLDAQRRADRGRRLLLQVGQGLAAGPEQRRGKRGPARERPVRGIAGDGADELRHALAGAAGDGIHGAQPAPGSGPATGRPDRRLREGRLRPGDPHHPPAGQAR